MNPIINPCYAAIKEHYGERCAKRSRVPLINHIDEGVRILVDISADEYTIGAFCIHPLLQSDEDLAASLRGSTPFRWYKIDQTCVALAMEYRRVANAYLSHHCKSDEDVFELSTLPQVNQMLIADKVQNAKDFLYYHWGAHPNTKTLEMYFTNWLKRLGVPKEEYTRLCEMLCTSAEISV